MPIIATIKANFLTYNGFSLIIVRRNKGFLLTNNKRKYQFVRNGIIRNGTNY